MASMLESFDPTRLQSREISPETWHQKRHVTWSRRTPPEATQIHEGDIVHKYGQSFIWSNLHQAASELQPLRQLGDPLADELVCTAKPTSTADLLPKLENTIRGTEDDACMAPLAKQLMCTPEWVDWDKIARGQQIFVRYAPACGMSLYYVSLVGGFSAPLITRVLRCTGCVAHPMT